LLHCHKRNVKTRDGFRACIGPHRLYRVHFSLPRYQ
jgi:hypothetical protein